MIINGKEFNIEKLSNKTLMGLVEFYKLNPSTLAIERNGSVEDRSEWSQIDLLPQDQIELIKFVGGG